MPTTPKSADKLFSHPPASYRSAPFYSWNDWLDPAELRRQIDEMKRVGIGGFFMHSRYGLETPFLEDGWWDAVAVSVEQARRNGMFAWIYDEDRWPSGFAGGKVTRDRPDLAAWVLECVIDEIPEGWPAPLATYRIRQREGRLLRAEAFTPSPGGRRPRGGGVAHIVARQFPPTDWWNGAQYVDTMNPEATRRFIEVAYEPYRERFAGDFGGTIPGIFTDEPNFMNVGINGRVFPWTPRMEAAFEEEHGYGLRSRILGLFFQTDDSRKIRHDYLKTCSRLFVEGYTKPLAEWCAANRLQMTGHYLWEHPSALQTHSVGAVMPHYVHMQLPGMDLLANRLSERITAKQVSSVCHQFGKPRSLSELYGVTSWDYSFALQKWQGDWHYALGINFRCQHLTLYSLRGARKRDYPQSYLDQSAWWPYYAKLEDYYGRLSVVLTQGEFASDILLLHNLSSTHCDYDCEQRDKADPWFEPLDKAMVDLLALHRDFDLGDETILAEHGRVEDSKLRIGLKAYPVVVIPPAINLRGATLARLRRFVESGGAVIALRPTPTHLDGALSDEIRDFIRSPGVRVIAAARDPLKRALDAALPPHGPSARWGAH